MLTRLCVLRLRPVEISQVLRLMEALVEAGVPINEVNVVGRCVQLSHCLRISKNHRRELIWWKRGPIDEFLHIPWHWMLPEGWRAQLELTRAMARLSGGILTIHPKSFGLYTTHILTDNPEIGHRENLKKT